MGLKEVEKKVIVLICERCGYEWERRNEGRLPRVCPRCTSPYWNVKRKNKVKKEKIYL